jgi:MFS transporter, PPP family, 3-phenylpropionic acid transporter
MPRVFDPRGVLACRISTFYGALFLIHGVSLTYLPVWLDGRGLSGAQIAIASSMPMLLRIGLTPAMAFLADRSGRHREMIVISCAIALAVLMALVGRWPAPILILLVAAMLIAVQAVMPLADTIAMAAVKREGIDYGRTRLWGSLTFILASYVAGFAVSIHGPEAVLILLIAGAGATATASLFLPKPRQGTAIARITVAEAAALARNPRFVMFVAIIGTIMASHAVLYVFGVLHWRAQGLSASYIATLWAISVVAEIALFWAARWVVPLGALPLILLGAGAGMLRWLAMAADPAPLALVPLQLLHAGTFAATHLGAMHWIAQRVPPQAAGTAQALLATSTAGLAMAPATFVSGFLYEHWAGGSYLAMMLLCVLGGAIGLALRRADSTQASAILLSPKGPLEQVR